METKYITVELKLTPSLLEAVTQWLVTFHSREFGWAVPPRLNGNVLEITAPCFSYFLGYADASLSNSLDMYRLRKIGIEAIRARREAMDKLGHRYLAPLWNTTFHNLNYIKVGEFL